MEQYIKKDNLIADIDKRIKILQKNPYENHKIICHLDGLKQSISTLEVKEVDLYNNGWIDCTKQMPQETKQESNTLQGHREWTESEPVLAWDSSYGARIDSTRNGKWRSEQIGGCTGQMIHGIIAWRPIPEFSEELLLKAQKGEVV